MAHVLEKTLEFFWISLFIISLGKSAFKVNKQEENTD